MTPAPVPPDAENPEPQRDELVTGYITGDQESLRFVDAMTAEEFAKFERRIDEAFADPPSPAGRAAASPDPPKDAHRPWPIAPDTVMPPRRQPVRWGSRADDPPTEIHNDPQTTKAYLAGLAAGRTEAAASPDERLREALREVVAAFPSPPDREMDDEEIERWYADHGDWFRRLTALIATDRRGTSDE